MIVSRPPVSSMIPGTEYFEVDSARVGARLAVWVTLPPSYNPDGDPYTVLYVTDGNTLAALTAPLAHALVVDPIRPVQPYVQVTIGYCGDDAGRAIRIRNRDLVPPGEPFPAQMAAHIRRRVDAGLVSEAECTTLLEELRSTHADRFLAFLEDELHPRIAGTYRVRGENAALFGYSYGGLFTLYAFTSGSVLFSTYGASSPGIIVPDSRVYELYEKLRVGTARDRRLHLTVNDSEGTGPNELYRTLSVEYLRFFEMLARNPLPGLHVTTATIPGESHATGSVDAYRSFVRACFTPRPAG